MVGKDGAANFQNKIINMQHQSQHVHRDRVLPFVYSCAKFRGAESSQVAGSISQASKTPKSNADNRRESIGRDFEDKIQLT